MLREILERVWQHARAVLVALHLFAVTFCALPSVGSGMNRSAWKQPTVQGEFKAWTERFAALGFEVTVPELEAFLWDFASGYEEKRDAIMKPFVPYFRYCGTWQSWKMFVAPHRYPGRLEIEIDRGEGWEPVFVARSSEHTWLRSWLDHDRFRAATFRYAWEHFKGTRNEFADFIALQAARDFPRARRIRVSFMRYRTRSPEEVRQGIPAEEKRELTVVRPIKRGERASSPRPAPAPAGTP